MTTIHPPHLPKHSTEETTRVIPARNIPTFLVTMVLSLASGIVGALVVYAWVIPGGYMNEGQWIPRGQNQTVLSPFVEPDVSIIRKVKNTAVEVFRDSEILSNGYYGSDAFIGEGVMLSSNGWGVLYAPSIATLASIPTLRVRDVQGTWYTPTSVVADEKDGLVYFKLDGTEFYVVSFPDWRVLEEGSSVWVYERGVWKRQTLGSLARISENTIFRAADERQRFELSPNGLSDKGLVIGDTGNLLGFIDGEGRLEDSWSIEHSIPQLLESATISADTIDWVGSMVETIEEGKVVQGFLIESSGAPAPSGLKRLDIVRAVNGVPVTEFLLHRLVKESPMTVQIWRNGELFDILIP